MRTNNLNKKRMSDLFLHTHMVQIGLGFAKLQRIRIVSLDFLYKIR